MTETETGNANANINRLVWIAVCLPALVPLVVFPVVEAEAVSQHGSDGPLWCALFSFVPFVLLALIAIPLLAVLSAVKWTKRYCRPALLACALFLAGY